ncbi:MAG: hypothetical protein QME51_08625 [Planctomycetota bacterium]|nr:hypothetical protein [Planctomycetota bacterium]
MYLLGAASFIGGLYLYSKANELGLPYDWIWGISGLISGLFWCALGYIITRLNNLTGMVSDLVEPQYDRPRKYNVVSISENKCPKCGLSYSTNATNCVCGYNFQTNSKDKPLSDFFEFGGRNTEL